MILLFCEKFPGPRGRMADQMVQAVREVPLRFRRDLPDQSDLTGLTDQERRDGSSGDARAIHSAQERRNHDGLQLLTLDVCAT
jgi:hypothetical protein